MIKLAPRYQLLVGLALAALLAMTRGQHFASVNLPSASWAVFFSPVCSYGRSGCFRRCFSRLRCSISPPSSGRV